MAEFADTLKALQEEGKTSLGRLIMPVYRAFNVMAQEKYTMRGHAGLTTAHTLLLANLDADGTRIVTLADRIGTTKQFTGRLVHQLAERNYILMEPDPVDKRAVKVRITPEGLQFFEDACAVKTEIEDMFKAIIGTDQLELIISALQKLSAAYSGYQTTGDISTDN
jgi:DNA-binding MarR family transcriptional regulator